MRRIAICLALAGLVAGAPACSKDKAGGGGAGAKGKPAGAAASALDIMPEDTAVIAGANITKLTASKLWEQYSPMLLNDGDAKEGLTKVKDNCGIDLTKDIHSVVFGVNGDLDEKKVVVLVKGAFDEAKVTKCLVTMAEKEEQKKIVAKTEGKITEYAEEGGDKVYIGWAGADTIVIVPAAMEGDKAALEAVMSGKSSAKNNKELAAIMGNVNTAETVWAAMVVPASGKLKDSMGGAPGPQPKALWVNLAYQKELALEIGARFANEKDAKEQVDKANKELEGAKADPTMGEYLKTVKAEAKGADAVFTVNLNEKQVDELVAKMKDLLPLLMMGMGGGM
jgi:hypothetical protein